MAAPSIHDTRGHEHEVTPLELFFDLVFVFAVSQLSHHLLNHLSWRGAAETLVMLLAILTVWSYTSWAATMIPADRLQTMWMVVAVMFLGLFMNASVTRAFTTSGWAFVAPLLMIQLGRTVWTIVHAHDAAYREHYYRVLIWFLLTTPLWILGAAANADTRLAWWALAGGLELVGTWMAHPVPGRRLQSEHVPFNAQHMLERCSLFLIIALGETVLTTGTAVAGASLTVTSVVTGTFALAGTVAIWGLAYGRSYRLLTSHLEETRDPVRTSRYAVNALMVMVAGLIAVAVANEIVVAHPHDRTSLTLGMLLVGGPVLFLAAQGWYLWAISSIRSRLHLVGGVVLVLVGVVTLSLRSDIALALVGITLTILAILDRRRA